VSTEQRENLEAVLRKSALPASGSVSEQRRLLRELSSAQPLPADVTVTGAALGAVPTAEITIDGIEPRHVVLYFHGGVYVLGDAFLAADLASQVGRRTRAKVISVDYRLGPEHPYPAAVDDALAAYDALLHNGTAPSDIVLAGEPAGPAEPAGQGQARDRPDPVQGLGQRPGAAQVPGRVAQAAAHRGQLRLQPLQHPQADGDLRLPGRGQAGPGQLGQLGRRVRAAEVSERRRALVEQHRVHPLHPRGVLGPQVVVELQQRPALHDVRRRDPAFRQPALHQQVPDQPRVGLVGLGVPLAAAGRRGVRRLGQVRLDPGALHLFHDVPPAGTPLHRQRHLLRAGEPAGQPDPQMLPVRRGDPPAGHLPGHGVQVIEGDLLPVDIQSAYDRWHRDLLTLRGQCPNTPIVVRLS
jgi:alpha/beta hydrolase fold